MEEAATEEAAMEEAAMEEAAVHRKNEENQLTDRKYFAEPFLML